MKQCSTCQEEFADKFSFCPVDGTPLNALAAAIVATPAPPDDTPPMRAREHGPMTQAFAVAGGEGAMAAGEGLYHLTIIEDTGLVKRLSHELSAVARHSQLTWPEFKRDPLGFTSRLLEGYGRAAYRFVTRPNVAIALLSATLFMLSLMGAVFWLDKHQLSNSIIFPLGGLGAVLLVLAVVVGAGWLDGRSSAIASTLVTVIFLATLLFGIGFAVWFSRPRPEVAHNEEPLELQQMVDIPDEAEQKPPDKGIGTGEEGRVGFNRGRGEGSKPKFEKAGGGGGGGQQDTQPTQQGKIPPPSNIASYIPKEPPVKQPLLPNAGIDIDPALYRNMPYDKYGDPRSTSTASSAGTGTGNGMGTGTGAGVGEGNGEGFGPGNKRNMGGGDPNDGGGGSGGGRGTNGEDYSRTFNAREVTQKARILSKPEPQYTEEARKNQISGTVIIKAVLASNGSVTNIRAVNNLPYGLTEKAIAAAHSIKFTPAMKDGHAVSQWVQIEYNFNLY